MAPPPLTGLLVLDFTTLLPGPLATLMLAETGAEVVKIERPGGEEMRAYPPAAEGTSAAFALLNRGKRTLVLDLKDAEQRHALLPLLARADVLVEQFRPGVMARLGLGYDALRTVNPRLVYCSITGYGQSGARAGNAGHDLNFMAAAGLLSGSAADRPLDPPSVQVADIAGGSMPAVINILLALMRRQSTGTGCHLDIAMTDSVLAFGWLALAQGWGSGRWPSGGDTVLTGGSPRYKLYPTADGRLVACAALEAKFWNAFCEAIDLPRSLRDDSVDPAATTTGIAAIVRSRGAEAWRPVFAAADCCAVIVATPAEAVSDRHLVARGLFDRRVAFGDGTAVPALPLPIASQFLRSEMILPAATLPIPD